MINGFSDNTIFSLDIRNRSSDVVFDTCIRYDEDSFWTIGETLVDIFKFVEMDSSCFDIFVFNYIKEKKSEKVSISWKSEENSLFRLLKANRTWLRW